MSRRESLARQNLIVKKLRRMPATFKEIADYLERESEIQGYNFTVSLRTFQRDIQDIASLYNIEIVYNRSAKLYKIEMDDQPEMNERIFEAFNTFNALNVSERISEHIQFEKRKPQGTEHLYGLLHAIKNRVRIRFYYQKFWEEKSTVRTAEPYVLKEFKNRWYVLAKDMKDGKIKTFGLDRISELEITKERFETTGNFDANEYYRYCFGIISPNNPDEKPQEIVLSFEPVQGKYIKSLPLHESQQILVDNSEEFRIKLTLFLTHDFFMEIRSYGSNVRIIQPEILIEDLKNSLEETAYLYYPLEK